MLFVINYYSKEVVSVDQEETCREMEAIMRQLSLEGQRYLVELARAAHRAEHYLDNGADASKSVPSPTKH